MFRVWFVLVSFALVTINGSPVEPLTEVSGYTSTTTLKPEPESTETSAPLKIFRAGVNPTVNIQNESPKKVLKDIDGDNQSQEQNPSHDHFAKRKSWGLRRQIPVQTTANELLKEQTDIKKESEQVKDSSQVEPRAPDQQIAPGDKSFITKLETASMKNENIAEVSKVLRSSTPKNKTNLVQNLTEIPPPTVIKVADGNSTNLDTKTGNSSNPNQQIISSGGNSTVSIADGNTTNSVIKTENISNPNQQITSTDGNNTITLPDGNTTNSVIKTENISNPNQQITSSDGNTTNSVIKTENISNPNQQITSSDGNNTITLPDGNTTNSVMKAENTSTPVDNKTSVNPPVNPISSDGSVSLIDKINSDINQTVQDTTHLPANFSTSPPTQTTHNQILQSKT